LNGVVSMKEKIKKLAHQLFDSIDIASLVVFRIAFGAIMVWEVYRYIAYNRIFRFYIEPAYNFAYEGFNWVTPWSGNGMYIHFIAIAIFGFLMMVGLFYRAAAIGMFFTFTYIFLLDKAQYLNHFYLVSLISFIMIFIPAHRSFSLDAKIWPKNKSNQVPFWGLALLRFQIGIPLLYGGFAKMNSDWLQAQPLQIWLSDNGDFPLIGSFIVTKAGAYTLSYGGLLFDLCIVPLLVWRKTRMLGLAAAILFNLMNAKLWNIGIFPWFMIAGTLLFLEPNWPRRLLGKFTNLKIKTINLLRVEVPLRQRKIILSLLGVFAAIQILLPFRHFLYPGNVSWTEEGHRFSWHMKLRGKAGWVRFYAENPKTGQKEIVAINPYLSSRQYRKMSSRPDMILQFSHFLADRYRINKGWKDVEIRVDSWAALNGRQTQRMIDPKVDLSKEPRKLTHDPWIIPLSFPLVPK